jgi:hypothetical protein
MMPVDCNEDDASFLCGLPFSVLQAFRDQVSKSRHYATLLMLLLCNRSTVLFTSHHTQLNFSTLTG